MKIQNNNNQILEKIHRTGIGNAVFPPGGKKKNQKTPQKTVYLKFMKKNEEESTKIAERP